jgi:hypothetical protein
MASALKLPKGPGLITVKVNSGELVETAFPFEDDDWDSLEKETDIDIDEVPSAAEVRVGEKLRMMWFDEDGVFWDEKILTVVER